MSVFHGSGVALITPFHEDKSVNYEMLGELADRQLAEQTDAMVVCGTTGEPATMTKEERFHVIRCVAERMEHRIPVIAGTGSNTTEGAVELAKQAQDAGADALLVVTPYYNKATQNGLYEHYRTIAGSTDLPIIMYNVPSRTGCNLLPQTAVRIAEDCKNVVGIKEASGNIAQIARLAGLGKGMLDLYSGNDDQIVPVLSLGGIGVISVLANVVPRQTHQIVAEFLNGNLTKSLELQLKYLKLVEALFCEVNPIPVKAAMKLMGYEVGGLRLPLTELEEKHKSKLQNVLQEFDLLISNR